MQHSDYIIYADESGDHGLTTIDPQYPIFVLNFCIFRKQEYVQDIVPKMQNFKFDHFGHDMVVLHEHSIRKQKPPFVFLQNQDKRQVFMAGLNQLVREANFSIITSVIDKNKLRKKYLRPHNPYELALQFCMEKAHKFLEKNNQLDHITYVVVEKRGKNEDKELELEFRRLCDSPDYPGRMPEFEIVLADKKTNSTGLQLADLTAWPIGRHWLNPDQPNRAWEIIQSKLDRKPNGEHRSWGLNIFP